MTTKLSRRRRYVWWSASLPPKVDAFLGIGAIALGVAAGAGLVVLALTGAEAVWNWLMMLPMLFWGIFGSVYSLVLVLNIIRGRGGFVTYVMLAAILYLLSRNPEITALIGQVVR